MRKPRRNPDLKAWLDERSIPEPNSGCWLWLGWCDNDGYGKANPSKLTTHRLAHRISFEAYRGPVPTGIDVLHRCDMPSCVNPDHLFLGDQLANMRDMIGKNRRANFKGSRHGGAKLNENAVSLMRLEATRGVSTRALAERFGISPRNARDVIARRLWTHVE